MKNRINEPAVMEIPQRIIKAGNSKVSEYVAVVNMPAGFTCPADAPCKNGCYALKGRYLFDNVNLSSWKNLYYFNSDSKGFFKAIEQELDSAENLTVDSIAWNASKKYAVKCNCRTIYRDRMCDIVKFPQLYTCNACKGKFERIK